MIVMLYMFAIIEIAVINLILFMLAAAYCQAAGDFGTVVCNAADVYGDRQL